MNTFQNIQPILTDLKQSLQTLYGERLASLILFGSYARNEAREDSDIDILMVLNDDEIAPFTEIDKISDITFQLLLDKGKVIQVVPTNKDKYEHQLNPLYIQIRKQGILL
ncbi:MAG: nucleotidyltransferase domain-containing protein [Chitinophagales bacterium]